jgi:hypothetical protein
MFAARAHARPLTRRQAGHASHAQTSRLLACCSLSAHTPSWLCALRPAPHTLRSLCGLRRSATGETRTTSVAHVVVQVPLRLTRFPPSLPRGLLYVPTPPTRPLFRFPRVAAQSVAHTTAVETAVIWGHPTPVLYKSHPPHTNDAPGPAAGVHPAAGCRPAGLSSRSWGDRSSSGGSWPPRTGAADAGPRAHRQQQQHPLAAAAAAGRGQHQGVQQQRGERVQRAGRQSKLLCAHAAAAQLRRQVRVRWLCGAGQSVVEGLSTARQAPHNCAQTSTTVLLQLKNAVLRARVCITGWCLRRRPTWWRGVWGS